MKKVLQKMLFFDKICYFFYYIGYSIYSEENLGLIMLQNASKTSSVLDLTFSGWKGNPLVAWVWASSAVAFCCVYCVLGAFVKVNSFFCLANYFTVT